MSEKVQTFYARKFLFTLSWFTAFELQNRVSDFLKLILGRDI